MTHPNLVESMKKPDFYPDNPSVIELIQTHISFIFITDNYVYKVKKAVNFGFLDFTSLDKRKFYCAEELRLNRRLAPDIYLDVLEIGETKEGKLLFGTGHRVIDYAVRMRKIPQDRMLKKMLSEGKIQSPVFDAIAKKLSEFHSLADTGGEIDLIGSPETIKFNHDENFAQTENYIGRTIPEYQYNFIRKYIYNFMDRHQDLLRQRVKDHRIRDCHGDLHLEHICIVNEIVIFDCIEFNERFRCGDVAAEVAFLTMDLDYNGYSYFGDVFVNAYVQYANDPQINTLLNFYKCYYAYVRGKVIGFRIDDEAINKEDRESARKTALTYFNLAYTYAARLESPALIISCGLMGTGKSQLARNIAPRIGAEIIRTDVLRKEMLDINPAHRHYEAFGEGIYSDDISKNTYSRAFEIAEGVIKKGKSAIIDASFKRKQDRLKAADLAARLQVNFFIIECSCPEDEIKMRLERRLLKKGEASDGRWDIYREQKNDFEKISEFSDECYLAVNTSQSKEESMNMALEGLKWRLK